MKYIEYIEDDYCRHLPNYLVKHILDICGSFNYLRGSLNYTLILLSDFLRRNSMFFTLNIFIFLNINQIRLIIKQGIYRFSAKIISLEIKFEEGSETACTPS